MKKFVAILAILVLPAFANAVITGFNCDDDGDGAIVMNTPTLSHNAELDEYTLAMDGVQQWFPAHVEGEFFTDTELDPTVWLAETVQNQTTSPWTGYEIIIGMTKTFTISSIIAPNDWTFVVTQPVAGIIPNGTTPGFVGKVVYAGGTPIGIGEEGDFGFKMSFLGGVSFCTQQTPIPEPATMTLLCMGALALIRRK